MFRGNITDYVERTRASILRGTVMQNTGLNGTLMNKPHFKSTIPTFAKKEFARNETKRITARCSDTKTNEMEKQ